MTSKFWLALNTLPYSSHVDFSDPDVLVIPVVPMQTGGSRSQISPGIYRQPRIRIYADKFGSVTSLSDQKEISFPALLYGASRDDIYAKWKQINFYLDRAEVSASPFPRGTGVVFVEQIDDAVVPTVWDVVSGVLSDVDTNMPGVALAIGILQLNVLPFSRGDVTTAPFGAARINGTGASYYVPYPGGDAPGLFELRLKDLSPSGHQITWVTVGRRWASKMQQNDFTAWHPTANSHIITAQNWQQLLPKDGAADWETFDWEGIDWDGLLLGSPLTSNIGPQQTGLFGVYAVVNDSSPIIADPSDVSLTLLQGRGSLSNGFIEATLVPKDATGNPSTPTARQLLTIENTHQPGNVQDSESFESGTWDTWQNLPSTAIASGGSASLSIEPAAALSGKLGAHFKVSGNSTPGSITSASAGRFMPPLAGTNIQSIAFQIEGQSWGSFLSPTPVAAPSSPPSMIILPAAAIPAPAAPAVIITSTPSGFNGPANFLVGYTWLNSIGETNLGTQANVILSSAGVYTIQVIIPALPAGVTGANIYWTSGGNPYQRLNAAPVGPGVYILAYNIQAVPPAVNTTAAAATFTGGQTYFAGFTWLTPFGQTTVSPLASFTNVITFDAVMTIPTFPAGVTGALIYVSRTGSGAVVTLNNLAQTAGNTIIAMGGLGGPTPPLVNTSGTPTPGSWDTTARFTWGSLTIVPSGTHNNFVLKIAGVQIGNAFSLIPGVIHQIGCNFRLTGTQVSYSLLVDGTIIGSASGALSNSYVLPITATWTAVAAGTAGPYTEEFYLDEIYVYDALLLPGFQTIGSAAEIRFTPDAFTSAVDFYYAIHGTGITDPLQWYLIQAVVSPFTLSAPIPQGAIPVTGPPTISTSSSYAELQARIGVGTGSINLLAKPAVRTKIGNGIDELVRLGSLELPPGAKSDTRDLDGWILEIWGKSGGVIGSLLTIKGVALFPEDENGWTGITAKVPSLVAVGSILHIGTNKYGRSYGQVFASDGTTLLGYMDVTGTIGSMPGDQDFIVLTGQVDALGRISVDLTQSFQLGHQITPRSHWESTDVGVP